LADLLVCSGSLGGGPKYNIVDDELVLLRLVGLAFCFVNYYQFIDRLPGSEKDCGIHSAKPT